MSVRLTFASLLFACTSIGAQAQDTLQTMPRFDRYEKLRKEISGSIIRGAISPRWSADSQSFVYSVDTKNYKFDLSTGKAEETTEAGSTVPTSPGRRGGQRGTRGAPERGRQFSVAVSEDGKLKATTRGRNVYISDANGKKEFAITTEGSVENRLKYGVASWVYGEELGVREAMWWSPDAKKLA